MRARRIGLGLVASGVVHAAAAGLLLWLGREGESLESREPVGVDWTAIEIIEEEAGSGTGTGTGTSTGTNRGSRSVSASESAVRPEARGLRSEARPTLGMRSEARPGAIAPEARGQRPEARGPEARPRLDPRRAAGVIVPDPGPPPPPQPLEGLRPRKPFKVRSELRPDGEAGFTTDEGAGTFVARTGRDGRVVFEDRSSFHIHLPGPRQIAKNIAGGLERWADDPRRYAEETDNQTPSILGGQFEITDSIMRMGGQDPYAARKMDFLDRTRAERMRIAAGENSERLRQSLHQTRADLDRMWRGAGTAAHKRRLLFQLWDECAESGSDDVVRTARAVRGQIVAFVRRHLPAGSRHAYSEAELARHNARRSSSARFEPYAAAQPPE